MLVQEGDALSNTLHAMSVQLGLGRSDGMKHVLHVCVEEHSTVHNAMAGQMVERIARNLPPANQHVVVLSGRGGYAQFG